MTGRLRLIALVALLASGCARVGGPPFATNLEGRDASKMSPSQKQAIVDALGKLFGTPDRPLVPKGLSGSPDVAQPPSAVPDAPVQSGASSSRASAQPGAAVLPAPGAAVLHAPGAAVLPGLNLELLEQAAGPVGGDATGRRRGLFRQLCVDCHGISGDGLGPVALTLDPYPRDFRRGVFKFTSTAAGAKPCRDDLRRRLQNGVPGTAMPSHARLPGEEIEALVEYVRYLSLRGQTELYLLQEVIDGDAPLPLRLDEVLEEGVLPLVRQWAEAETRIVAPPPRPPIDTPEQRAASIELGKSLFGTKESQCVKCHGSEGRGDGEERVDVYDDWNKAKLGITPEQTEKLARLFTLPIVRLRPRNFREGVFRGGDRPEDLYLRIHVGIKGTPMPGVGPMPGSAGVLTTNQIWHVVDYVRSLAPGAKP